MACGADATVRFGPKGKILKSEWAATLQGRSRYHYLKTKAWLSAWLGRLREISKQHPRLRYSLFVSFALIALGFIAGTVYFAKAVMGAAGRDIRSVSRLEESTHIYNRDGKLIYQFYEKKRTVVPLWKISKEMRQAILAVEDRNFYQHPGFQISAIVRAAISNFTSGRTVQGGSTLTQQLAKNVFLTSERSYKRKVQELWLARRIENSYSKNQILEMYANRIYFGSGYYGVEEAARGYFGKSAAELSLEEAATLAGIARSPKIYSPHVNPSLAQKRRNLVLEEMTQCGFITPDRATAAKQQALAVRARTDDSENTNYAIDYVKEQLHAMFRYEKIFNGGMRVYTTLDGDMQKSAEAAVESHLAKIENQRGFGRVSRAGYLERHPPTTSDGEQPDYLQGALVSMDVHSGEIYALVGGRNYKESKFNRAVYAKRQPGSAFKPFVYAAALETGMTPATVMDNSPMQFATADGIYRPANAHGKRYGAVTLRTALRNSINTVSIELGQLLGAQKIIRTAHDFGIEEDLPCVISLPLGVGEVTLLEMVKAYSAFPNEGRVVQPSIIRRVENKDGEVLYENHLITRYAVNPETAFLMTSMLADAVDRGTGSGIRAAGFRLPAGGKTGTTDDFRDAWFVGFTPDVVTGVWVGFDAPQKIARKGYGAVLAVPIWADFMKHSFTRTSVKEFPMPAGIVRAAICVKSGQLAGPWCGANIYADYFSVGNVPQFPCEKHVNPEPTLIDGDSTLAADPLTPDP